MSDDFFMCPDCDQIMGPKTLPDWRTRRYSCCGYRGYLRDAPGVVVLQIETKCPCRGTGGPWNTWGKWNGRGGIPHVHCISCGQGFDTGF